MRIALLSAGGLLSLSPLAAYADPAPTIESRVSIMRLTGTATRDLAAFDQRGFAEEDVAGEWLGLDLMSDEQRRVDFKSRTDLFLSVDLTGQVEGCEVLQSDLKPDQAETLCQRLRDRARFGPRYVEPGRQTAWQSNFAVWMRTDVRGPGSPRPEPVRPPTVRWSPTAESFQPTPRYWSDLYVADFPKLADHLPRGAKGNRRTSIGVTVEAAKGVTLCEILSSSGQAELDDFACATARSLPYRFLEITTGDTKATIPLQFQWDGKNSHIRVPLPTDNLDAVVRFDPLDKRTRREQAGEEKLLSPKHIPPVAYEGIVVIGALQRQIRAKVAYGTDGRATSCILTSSSGDADMDAATCRYILAEWRFQPAEDMFGDLAGGMWWGMVTF